jgi:glycosyltransferase involved in cell wall biosynthesis
MCAAIHHQMSANPLAIAMVVPPWYEIPPRGYGGIELVCAALTNALAARGHDVTIFGAGHQHDTAGHFVSTMDELQHPWLGQYMPAVLHAARVENLLRQHHFDVIHDHSPAGPLTAAHRLAPTVVTVHGPVDGKLGDLLASVGDRVRPVAISQAQRRSRTLPWAGTVYNGIDTSDLSTETPSVGAAPDGPALWLGRFCPEKGPDLAIRACRAAGIPLVLAGKCNEASEAQYLADAIQPMLGSDVTLVTNADRPRTQRLLERARCLLMPIRWNEPFGMVMVEAMASGTPVVALRRGSVPEVVRSGVTGFICDDPGELPKALRDVEALDPAACVAHVRAQFGADLMALRYESVYHRAIAQARPPRVAAMITHSPHRIPAVNKVLP